jgi:3-phenylpropionate/trans-cinnamate dioxygenase ferredoxin reductase component
MHGRKDNGRIVIVGAGQAGLRTAIALRDLGHAGSIVLVGDEPHLPYERPQLSKACLSGSAASHKSILEGQGLVARGIDFRGRWPVTLIDRTRKMVRCASEGEVGYDALVLALGGTARILPGVVPGDRQIFALRSADDAAALNSSAEGAKKGLVVGGGWLGLEIAASLRQRGVEMTVLEAGARLCGRVAPPSLSNRLAALHTMRGNRILIEIRLKSLQSDGRRVTAVLASGETMDADLAVVAVGMTPNVALAAQAGLDVDDGIVVDNLCRTSDPDIYAVGDCTEQAHPFFGRRMRLESWQNANTQADIAAAAILGLAPPPTPIPWFWSDQFNVNVQMLGDTRPHLEQVERGDGFDGATTLFFGGDSLAGIVAFNAPRDIGIARRLIDAQTPLDKKLAGDPAVKLSGTRSG